MVLFRSGNPTSTTNSDAGQIIFRANQSAASGGGTKEHASIKTEFNTDTHSARLRFNTLSSSGSGNDYEYLRFDGGVRDIVFNEEGRDIDFRVEGDNDRFMHVIDANVNRASIGMNFVNCFMLSLRWVTQTVKVTQICFSGLSYTTKTLQLVLRIPQKAVAHL